MSLTSKPLGPGILDGANLSYGRACPKSVFQVLEYSSLASLAGLPPMKSRCPPTAGTRPVSAEYKN
eukprot:13033646-Alexandrium_andersonii.AAC.1